MTANAETTLEALKKVCACDSIHFTATVYNNLAASIVKSKALRVDRPTDRSNPKTHY
jgi:hypothetical protein